ncbi:MAG: 3-dehydroquinate synthase [candidate division Zixibacteria bacterium]|nr:3-dehydroquinate synthase [candidate division Zixibacteria bacterium]
MNIKVKSVSPNNNYSIQIKTGLISDFGQIIKKKSNGKIVVLTNKKVHRLWYKKLHTSFKWAGIKEKLIIVPDGERYKNNRTYNKVISNMLENNIDRYSTLVTFGGGVIGDLGGFVAATYMRGITLIYIPTTLIAQVDSSIGGKVAIDHPKAKNIIGAFYNPELVLTDPDILKTLSDTEYTNGLFEVVKIALVYDKKLYVYFCKNFNKIINRDSKIIESLIKKSAKLKAEIIQKDPFEKDLRMILNFGHTFGHALETSGGYKNISHGVAVGWGMLLALNLSENYKLIDLSKHQETIAIIKRLLGKNKLGKLNLTRIWATMCHDKKAVNKKVRFVLLKGVGRSIIKEVDKKSFIKSLGKL